VQAATIKQLARECGFELAGVAAAEPLTEDFAHYEAWADAGMAGRMGYLTDHRAEKRRDPRNLLPVARSVICVGKLYHVEAPASGGTPSSEQPPDHATFSRYGTFSRYAWGRDYHNILRERLEQLAERIARHEPHQWKVCVDTAPILERSYARAAGLGWIGKNHCLINQPLGSWFFLGELLTSLVIAPDTPPADRCGSCTRCIDACPTQAIVPCEETPFEEQASTKPANRYQIDARRCITYFNVELKGPIPEEFRAAMGGNVIGCDICQDVCPWNRRAPSTEDPAFAAAYDPAPGLETLAALTEEQFEEQYRNTPVARPKYDGFLRNVAVAMGANPHERFRAPLERLSRHESPVVAAHAQWALGWLDEHARLDDHHKDGQPSRVCVEAS
jgi:epoxyqueuosine reductase